MNSNDLKKLLEDVKNGSIDVEHAYKEIKNLPYET